MSMEEKLTFGKLQKGQNFIVAPTDDDNETSDDLKKPYHIFKKIDNIEEPDGSYVNAVKLCDGNLSGMPDQMEVILVK